MSHSKEKHADPGKVLRNTIRLRRWMIVGGIAVGVQALLNAFTHPESLAMLVFHILLTLGCIGYGLAMTPRIRKLSAEVQKDRA